MAPPQHQIDFAQNPQLLHNTRSASKPMSLLQIGFDWLHHDHPPRLLYSTRSTPLKTHSSSTTLDRHKTHEFAPYLVRSWERFASPVLARSWERGEVREREHNIKLNWFDLMINGSSTKRVRYCSKVKNLYGRVRLMLVDFWGLEHSYQPPQIFPQIGSKKPTFSSLAKAPLYQTPYSIF